MEEIIGRIIEAEKNAEKILKDARTRESELRTRVERESVERLDRARREAKRRFEEKVGEAREKGRKTLEEAIRTAEEKSREFQDRNRKRMEEIAEKVVRLIVSPEHERTADGGNAVHAEK